MTGKPTPARTLTVETVEVVVVVNHDDLRRGERGVVELNDLVRARLDKGYLKLAEDNPAEATPALGSTATRVALLGVAGEAGPPQ